MDIRGVDIRGMVPLDADSLIRQAIENTGPSDFGADDWREPFEVNVKARAEARRVNARYQEYFGIPTE